MIDTEGLTIREYCHKRLFNWCKLKGYSQSNTFFVYRGWLNMFLDKFPEPENIGLLSIQEFASTFTNDNTRKGICIIIRWIYLNIYGREIDFRELPYPVKKRKVQPIYTQEEVLKFLNAAKNNNEKHAAMLALIIDCGLRVSEPCAINLNDCFPDERKIILRNAKGNQDRIVYPSDYVWKMIKLYLESEKEPPNLYLFEGQFKGNPYTTSSIRQFLQLYCRLSNVEYKGTHAIRRFAGTWWIENEVPRSAVAKILGHSSTRTIDQHYIIHSPTYLKSIQSPLN